MDLSLAEMEAELAALEAKVAEKRKSVREQALAGIRQMLASGTLHADDLRELLNIRKPGRKANAQEAAAA